MNFLKMLVAILASAVMFAGVGVTTAAAADCARGTQCLWVSRDYSSTKYGRSANSGAYVGSGINNASSSGWANGGSCSATRFYDDVNAGERTDNIGQYRFVLNSQYLVGANYRDPYFTNGAGLNSNGSTGGWADDNWNDKVSSWRFTGC
jgi:hypothetical protein